jgi:hypothetical protein
MKSVTKTKPLHKRSNSQAFLNKSTSQFSKKPALTPGANHETFSSFYYNNKGNPKAKHTKMPDASKTMVSFDYISVKKKLLPSNDQSTTLEGDGIGVGSYKSDSYFYRTKIN